MSKKKFLNFFWGHFPLMFDIFDKNRLWPSEMNNNSWCQRLGVHSVEARLPACHQVGRQDQAKLFDAELANWRRSKQLLTLWFLLSLYYSPRSPLKSYFFRNCQYCWRQLVGDGGNFVPNSGWTEKCTISKCIFSLSKNIDPRFFLTFSLKSWNNKN